MKLPRLPILPKILALHYGLAAILLGSSMTALAETPKKEMVEAQQQKAIDAIDAEMKAEPDVEARPAVTTKKTLKPPSEGGKLDLIESQKKETEKSIKDAEAVNSAADVKPAATNLN